MSRRWWNGNKQRCNNGNSKNERSFRSRMVVNTNSGLCVDITEKKRQNSEPRGTRTPKNPYDPPTLHPIQFGLSRVRCTILLVSTRDPLPVSRETLQRRLESQEGKTNGSIIQFSELDLLFFWSHHHHHHPPVCVCVRVCVRAPSNPPRHPT